MSLCPLPGGLTMSPLVIRPQVGMGVCSVTRSGIGLTQTVVERTRWKVNDKIQIAFIEKARVILLRSVEEAESFKLAYMNTRSKTGGRISCLSFIRNYLQTVVELPKKKLAPVFLPNSEWTLGIPLQTIVWQKEEFSKSGVASVPSDAVGVYELLGPGNAVLRVGEGKIRERINSHLADKRFAPPAVKAFHYLALEDPEDGKILEKMRIAEYEAETGVLPRFQEIRA